jgi:hypothetical protein
VFHKFEYLPATANARVLNLTTQHPSAQIDRSLDDFRAGAMRRRPPLWSARQPHTDFPVRLRSCRPVWMMIPLGLVVELFSK